MIKFNVFNRFTGNVQFTAEVNCKNNNSHSLKLRLAVKWAIKNNADLSYADLSYANLRSADLSYADLSYADLSYADLSYADLSYADLSYADLRSASLSSANLRYANLSYADLSYADLRYAKNATIPVIIGQVGDDIRTGYAIYTDDKVMVRLGCFYGDEKEAIKAVSDKYGSSSGYAMMVRAACKVAKERKILNSTGDNQ